MVIIFLRTILLYIVVLLALRIMGKSELSNLSTFQMVIMFMIAELASIPMDSEKESLIHGVIAIGTLSLLQVLLSFASLKSERIKNLINGKPCIFICNGKINVRNMAKLRITINDLFEQLRIAGCPSPSDVSYAIMESNGEISVIPKDNSKCIPLILVNDGYLYETNLSVAGFTKEEFVVFLRQFNISSVKKAFLVYMDDHKKVHIYLRPDKGESFARQIKQSFHFL